MKILYIAHCKECKHMKWSGTMYTLQYRCAYDDNNNKILDIEEFIAPRVIPEWCPLEDAK